MSRQKILKKRAVNQDVWSLAVERMMRAYQMFDHIAVSFSGGKDSTACLHVVLEAARASGRLPLDVVFLDEECIPYETEEYVRRVAALPGIAMRWYALPVKHRNSCSPTEHSWYPWDPDIPEKWVRPLPPEAVPLPGFTKGMRWQEIQGLIYGHISGSVGIVMGIRAQESVTRYRAVARRRAVHWVIPYSEGMPGPGGRKPRHLWKVYPIYDWTTEDVWTAPARLGWGYNRAYDLLEMAGLPPLQQRCAPPFGDEPIRGLWTFQVCFPAIWEKMHDRVPGAATAARYGRTGLYGFGERWEKPAGQTWPEYIRTLVAKHEEPVLRLQVTDRLRALIREHYSKTRDPLTDIPHPRTGLSWPFLAMVALRGDTYNRKIASTEATNRNTARLQAHYAASLAGWKGEALRAAPPH